MKGFAWPGLSNEFLKVLASKSFGREGRAYVPADLIESAATRYFDLRLISITDEGWTEEVWHLIRDERVSPPDAWPLATAIQLDAELWLTHDHADSFVSAARRLHPAVYTLAADGDRLP